MSDITISLEELIANAKKKLSLLGYAASTKNLYSNYWNHFLLYAEEKCEKHFTKKLGYSFLKDRYGIKNGMKRSPSQVFKIRIVTILDEMLEHDCFYKCHQKTGKQVPPEFHEVLDKYEKLQLEKSISERTINSKKIILIRCLNYLKTEGITDITNLTANEVLSYLSTLAEYSNNTKSSILFALRNFLLFLHENDYVKDALNDLLPVILSNKDERLPSYYSTDEIGAILCQVDRNTEFGRRDYLILILAIQLGMRAGDIRQLKFDNIKINCNTIEFVQQKTNKPLQLPLTEEVKYSLADYLKNSRPKVDDPHIFMRHKAPLQPFAEGNSFYHITNKYIKLAGIELRGRKHGLHSMRHSTASNLLQNSTPYPVISGILGHKNRSTTKLYLRIDIQQLRTVALEVSNER